MMNEALREYLGKAKRPLDEDILRRVIRGVGRDRSIEEFCQGLGSWGRIA